MCSVRRSPFLDESNDRYLSIRDAGFEMAMVERRSRNGAAYWLQEPTGVPKIPAAFLSGVFYLYRSVDAAVAGDKYGGTGFFVGIQSKEKPGANYVYAVSNWHVAVRDGFSVLRVNTLDAGPENWEFNAEGGHDVAVMPIIFGSDRYKFTMTGVDGFVTKEKFTSTDESPLGVGDDVFMVGRFVDHDGGPTNQPAARFGHISIGLSKLRSALGKDVEHVCLDTNSRTGFSGSPVFVYRTMVSDLEELTKTKWHGTVPVLKHPMMMLLGVHTGQFPEWWDAREAPPDTESASKAQVRGLSGMTRVAPAWAIREILDSPKLKGPRDAIEAALAQAKKTQSASSDGGEESAAAFGVASEKT